MKLSIKAGATSQSVNVFVRDSSSTTGAGLAAVAPAGGSLLTGTKLYYSFTGTNASAGVAVSLSVLAAVNSAWASAGIVTLDATNMIGWVRIDLPDAALVTAKGRVVSFHLYGGTNMAPTPFEVELTGWDNQDAVHGGLTCLPNTAVTSNASLLTSGSSTDQLLVASGKVVTPDTQKVDVNTIKGQAITCAAGVTVLASVGTAATSTAQTGDGYAIVSHITYGNAQLVRATTPANTLDVSATGEAGLDFNNIKDATGAHTLTNITVPVVTTVTNQLTAAQVATGIWQDTTPGDFTVASSVGKSVFTGRAPGDVLGGLICNNAAAQLSALAVNGSTTLNTLSVASTTTLTGAVSAPAGIAANLTGNITGNITGDLIGDVTGGVTLADGVAHGGSTATMTLQQLTLDNSSGTAFVINSDTADGINISAANDGIFVSSVRDGLSLSSGRFGVKISATSSGIDLSCGGVGLDISSGNVAINGANGIQADLLGAVTDISPAALAQFFTTDTTKVYADSVTGSVVKEIASNAGSSASTTAEAVWDLATSGHTTSGTFGAAMIAAGSTGDPWATSLPGSYGFGTAGFILGINLDSQVSNIQADTNDIQNRLPTALDGSGNILANVQTFDGNAPVQTSGKLWVLDGSGNPVAAVGSAMTLTSGERNSIAAALLALADGVETGVTVKQTLRLLAAGVAGKRSNCGTTSEQYDAAGSPGTARIVGNLNSSGDGTPTLTP